MEVSITLFGSSKFPWVCKRTCSKFIGLLGTRPRKFSPALVFGDRGGTVVKVLCYKSEGRWFDSRWCHWNLSST